MPRPWERSIASMSGVYLACAAICWAHGRAQKMPPAKSSSSCNAQSRATTGRFRSPGGCSGWRATNALTLCGAGSARRCAQHGREDAGPGCHRTSAGELSRAADPALLRGTELRRNRAAVGPAEELCGGINISSQAGTAPEIGPQEQVIMECYSEQIMAIATDGELGVEETLRLRNHLATCLRCRQLLDALRAESRILSESLQVLPEEAASPMVFPSSPLSVGWGEVAAVVAVLALGSTFWINELSIPESLDWLNPFSVSGRANLLFNLFYYLAHGGSAMLADYAVTVGEFFLLLLLGGSVLLLGRRWWRRQPGLRLLIVLLAFSLPGFGLEQRHSDFVNVAANETVDDTLLATGNIVRVEGVVNGDLLAFGATVEVRGTIKGDLISCATKRTVVTGTVEGRIYDLSNALDLDGELGHST